MSSFLECPPMHCFHFKSLLLLTACYHCCLCRSAANPPLLSDRADGSSAGVDLRSGSNTAEPPTERRYGGVLADTEVLNRACWPTGLGLETNKPIESRPRYLNYPLPAHVAARVSTGSHHLPPCHPGQLGTVSRQPRLQAGDRPQVPTFSNACHDRG